MKTALLIIDIQQDYFPNGKMELEGSLDASLRAKDALAFFRSRGLPVIHIQHVSRHPSATFFLPETPGVQIHSNVAPLPGEAVIQKHYPNSFRETRLLEHLRQEQIERLVICGMQTNMCVEAATRAACDYGLTCLVLHDACAARQLTFKGLTIPAAAVHGAFLAALSGTYAQILSVAEFIASFQN